MESILEYIMSNYTWFLGSLIIILLAIIGSYADKTNFGQGKSKDQENAKNNNELDINKTNEGIGDLVGQFESKDETTKEIQSEELMQQEQYAVDQSRTTGDLSKEIITDNVIESKPVIEQEQNVADQLKTTENLSKETTMLKNDFEDNFERFDKEFNELLPQKEIVDDEFLDEIENISLDKTQKIDLSQIPDLDDVELPKIKSLESEPQDIWKF